MNATTHLIGKPPKDSAVEMTELVLPSHTNAVNTIFGGQVVAWMDIAGAICAQRHSKRSCVTASIDALHFLCKIFIGQVVVIRANVNYAHKTSMEIGIRVESEDPKTGDRNHTASGYFTYVAVDDAGTPRPVPPVTPETEQEKQWYQEAQERRAARLALVDKLKKKG